MLRIRLRRTGAKKKPTYRVVVADARAPRDGAFVEILGHYNPRTEPSTFVIDVPRTQQWLARGAQPTDRVARLLKREGILTAAGAVAPAAAEASAAVEAPAEAPAAAPRRSRGRVQPAAEERAPGTAAAEQA